ncbi:hypothetical protein [Phycisphaera mikurensis]|uniref:Transposase IS200-like domain-containing protein n=1 Tax=Phycisphaera mikurensis (strain NBRC 102666 / KCTC 22515 / FYK2301M01) TaxID=1142394 RepID=I0IHH8_PHYMF|nr:hypothetical protein [Phycisphaera mikurensis]MBB6440963.1 hypothetical protein [Phycisphaera mikurensis]BAM04716.1 hypothetical protein PSMK_25570 [Phycisphaera mikurensis NBRC 102666]
MVPGPPRFFGLQGFRIARRNRHLVVDPERPQVWHVTSRCSRELFLLDEPPPEFREDDRVLDGMVDGHKRLLLDRVERLAGVFCIEVIAFCVMGNHIHLVLRSVPGWGSAWSPEEVVGRWLSLHPVRDRRGPVALEPEDVAALAGDAEFVASTRRKLMNLSQFMKDLKQHVAVVANKLDGAKGPFWAGRFKSKPITDQERGQLVKTMVYVDLNPLAARLCITPEAGRFTSLEGRLGCLTSVAAAPEARTPASWLVALEGDASPGGETASRVVLPGLTLRRYLNLLDIASRLFREGKATIPRDAASIFERLGLDPDDLLSGFPRFARGSPHF